MHGDGADRRYDLNYFEDRLRGHFIKLKESRASAEVVYPLYALEHGLCESEICALKCCVREEIQVRKPSFLHKLPWIVYAAELGYQYSGDEYWQTFEDRTPGWSEHGDRYLIREWYTEFAGQYCAAEPTGRWADHFSIICWPITHAILPKDLQRQLARLLFETRHLLSLELLEKPLELGTELASYSWRASSRFQTFAQQHWLLGQISAALLLHKQTSHALIETDTLDRITNDLAEEQVAGSWLNEARHSARNVVLKGLIRGDGTRRGTTGLGVERSPFAVRPHFYLQRSEWDSWSVFLEMPDLSPIMIHVPESREYLQSARCKIFGTNGRWKARGWLTYGCPRVKLEKWPITDSALFTFDPYLPDSVGFLRQILTLDEQTAWVFKVGTDGLAREVRSCHIVPDCSYIIVAYDGANVTGLASQDIDLLCDGVRAFQFEVPNQISHEIEKELRSLGIAATHSVRVEPIGIVPKAWDGEGVGRWLSTDTITLVLSSSLTIETYFLKFAGNTRNMEKVLQIQPKDSSKTVIQLPQLAQGDYCLDLAAKEKGSDQLKTLGKVFIGVDDPVDQGFGASGLATMFVVSNPASPDLEDFWLGKTSLSILGPPGFEISPTAKFLDDSGDCIDGERFPRLCLPVSPTDWKEYLKNSVPQHRIQNLLNRAHECRLTFDAENLGRCELCCQRHILPVRWSVIRHGQRTQLLLSDHTETGVQISFFSSARPSRKDPLGEKAFLGGAVTWQRDGLLLAVSKEYDQKDALVVVPGSGNLRPEELGVRPQVDHFGRNTRSVWDFLKVVEAWSGSRITNTVGAIRRYHVLKCLHQALCGVISGFRWVHIEKSTEHIHDMNTYVSTLRSELDMPFKASRFAWNVSKAYDFLDRFSPQDRAEYMSFYLDTVWHLEYPKWLSEFILRLASSPESITGWIKGMDVFEDGMQKLFRMPYLLRLSRLFVLSIHKKLAVKAHRLSDVPIYGGWDWDY